MSNLSHFIVFLLCSIIFYIPTIAQQNLSRPSDVAISADGTFLYAAMYTDNAISVYRFNEQKKVEFVELKTTKSRQLSQPRIIQSTNDNKHLYVVNDGDNTISIFNRNEEDGTLSFSNKCAIGISNVEMMTISPDGKNIYAVAPKQDAISVLKRNPSTGILNEIEIYQSNVSGKGKIDMPQEIAISPDGKYVYLAVQNKNIILVLNRNLTTGKLTFQSSSQNDKIKLQGINSLCMSPDGKFIYATSILENLVLTFQRNQQRGTLNFVEQKENGEKGKEVLHAPSKIIASANGKYLYILSTNDNSLNVFTRNETSGKLNFSQQHQEGQKGVNGMNSPIAITTDHQNKMICLTSFDEGALYLFKHNGASRTIQFFQYKTPTEDFPKRKVKAIRL